MSGKLIPMRGRQRDDFCFTCALCGAEVWTNRMPDPPRYCPRCVTTVDAQEDLARLTLAVDTAYAHVLKAQRERPGDAGLRVVHDCVFEAAEVARVLRLRLQRGR